MKLYLISQNTNNDYDTYDSAVVCAPDEDTARNMNPANGEPISLCKRDFNSWCDNSEDVSVKYLGEAIETIEKGVVCASFNAG